MLRDDVFDCFFSHCSWNVGPMHIISISTEIYFDFLQDGVRLLDHQYDWLVNDLKVSDYFRFYSLNLKDWFKGLFDLSKV